MTVSMFLFDQFKVSLLIFYQASLLKHAHGKSKIKDNKDLFFKDTK